MSKSKIIIIICAVLVIIAGWIVWGKLASTTKIGLVNFQQFQLTSLIKSNTDDFISFEEVSLDELDKLKKYDFVLGFGMGMNVSAEQRDKIQSAADNGVPIYIYAATNPDNNICNLDSIQKESVSSYISNGNRKNYQNLARYIRQHIDKKSFFVTPADSVVESASDVLYHLDENVSFNTVGEYEKYIKEHNFYKEGGASVAIVGGLNDPFSGNRANIDSMIVSFQNAGMNVYPVSSAMKRLDFLKQIQPDAVVYYAHGRLAMGQADAAVEWLKERNIPMFSPLTILQTKDDWMKDPMGMFGGFMSQSIVMPELDGAIYPYVVNAQEVDDDGLYLFKAIPDRLKNLTQIVNNFISLQKKNNVDKKVAIYYFKGAGQETLTAQGLETVPSLFNLLKRLKAEGYKVDNLPATEQEFEKLLMAQGAVLSTYAEGAFDNYLKNGKPALVEKSEYESWINQSLSKELYADVVNTYGEAPGAYMSVHKDNKYYLAVARVQLGNIVLLPQPMAALGGDAFAIVHGAKSAPPHTYIGAYLWSQYAFKADAMLHFGTHGSLEFTPQKQVALSSNDWPDRLVGTIPHFYYYTIGNIGESMMAKRRSYATTLSYLTPPFMESNTRSQFKSLQDRIRDYYKTDEANQSKASLAVKKIAVQMGLHRELRLDSVLTTPYSTADIERIENFSEEIANEKMTGQLYTTGVPYDAEKIKSSVLAMSADPIAYSLAALDKQRGKVTEQQLKNKVVFTQRYLEPAKMLVNQVLSGKAVDSTFICQVAGVSTKDLSEAKKILTPPRRGMMAMAASSGTGGKPTTKSGGGHPSWIPKIGERPAETKTKKEETPKPAEKPKQPEYTKEQKDRARAITEVERTINNIVNYKNALLQSPELEMKSILNALSGGYIAPSSGGDAVANPNAVPTGRNLYSINAEATPSEVAWDKGVSLVNATLDQYKKQHGEYPKKVSYTFWSSEFIESEGTTIAQALYMLGVEPVRDAFGRVSDIQLISSETLGRPRIDVVVQTSGQFRDLAASRLSLITRAVEMAASAKDDKNGNYVSSGTTEIERQLVEQGIPPKNAREMSTQRVFGGINGMYGTGIQGMVTSGDKWENEKEIADTYINNMGAVYGSDKEWGEYKAGLLRAVLHNTDVVVQPRQSNTWGALSLDHVYEFMGGMNLAVRDVTGKDPDAYFADYRNRNNVKMQELKEAIGVESRSTVFNPAYIKEVMKGKASSASQITEVVTNTYAWNVMKPDVIDNEMWDQLYDVYVKDSHNLGVQSFFKQENPAAMQEITAVMMETARKGMWKASEQQLADVAKLHTDLVNEFGATGSGFSGSNAKLQDFIAQKSTPENATGYKQQLQRMKTADASSEINKNGTVLKKDSVNQSDNGEENSLNGIIVVAVVLVAFLILLFILRKKRKSNN
ncbi:MULTISPECIES: cobaltochelatase subunit CobN [unclassified Dysgonomonas]|uniref:cobaltochelatase subunit CobN n=1 Tax=unclassified Dysgonomonas TaxID=2630389 RepID=UPI0025B87D26|nr:MULTISPECIES: cobaltochelatase subunit CobN [unclassified Dysgonomonas]MDR2004714.1 cobaltochelatase subunit CobN [Prevotella sp.]HMM01839.1 cobaltochelatase subunit CobN [Dysgonomonas sp.]